MSEVNSGEYDPEAQRLICEALSDVPVNILRTFSDYAFIEETEKQYSKEFELLGEVDAATNELKTRLLRDGLPVLFQFGTEDAITLPSFRLTGSVDYGKRYDAESGELVESNTVIDVIGSDSVLRVFSCSAEVFVLSRKALSRTDDYLSFTWGESKIDIDYVSIDAFADRKRQLVESYIDDNGQGVVTVDSTMLVPSDKRSVRFQQKLDGFAEVEPQAARRINSLLYVTLNALASETD